MISDLDFAQVVASSYTISDIIRKISTTGGVNGGVYSTIKKRIFRQGLDTSHFVGRGHMRGKTHSWNKSKLLIQEMLVDNSSCQRQNLKRRLLEVGLLVEKCSECGLEKEWNGKPIVLHLDHVNGVNNDNRIENLRMICPNCHSQTSTYCGRKKKNNFFAQKSPKRQGYCKACQKIFTLSRPEQQLCSIKCSCMWRNEKRKAEIAISRRCLNCNKLFLGPDPQKFCSQECFKVKSRKVIRPSKEELETKITAKIPWTHLAKDYGVSDNAVRKWAKTYGICLKNQIS